MNHGSQLKIGSDSGSRRHVFHDTGCTKSNTNALRKTRSLWRQLLLVGCHELDERLRTVYLRLGGKGCCVMPRYLCSVVMVFKDVPLSR